MWEQLKNKMSKAKSVEEWNLLRDEAKLEYPLHLINQLDTSGFIHKILHP